MSVPGRAYFTRPGLYTTKLTHLGRSHAFNIGCDGRVCGGPPLAAVPYFYRSFTLHLSNPFVSHPCPLTLCFLTP
jgi:hypothetical protein